LCDAELEAVIAHVALVDGLGGFEAAEVRLGTGLGLSARPIEKADGRHGGRRHKGVLSDAGLDVLHALGYIAAELGTLDLEEALQRDCTVHDSVSLFFFSLTPLLFPYTSFPIPFVQEVKARMNTTTLGLLRERLAQDWLSREYVIMGPAGAHGGVLLGTVAGLLGDETGPKFRAWRSRLKGAGGISIGSMFAVGVALGMDLQRLRYLLNHFPFGTIFTEDVVGELSVSLADVIRGQEDLGLGAGLMSGASLYAAADYVLASGGVSNKVTFAEFHAASGFDLRIVATDLKSMRPVLFSHEQTPHTRIISAMVASMSIPIMFKPARIRIKGSRGLQCIDGAIVDPFGVHLFPEQLKANNVLVVCKNVNLHTPHRTNSMSSVLMASVMMAATANLSFSHLPMHNYAFGLVGIDTGRDETQVASWAQLFDSPSTNEFVLDGIASVDNMALTHLVLVYAVLSIVGSSGSRSLRAGSEAEPSPTSSPEAGACAGSPPTSARSHAAI